MPKIDRLSISEFRSIGWEQKISFGKKITIFIGLNNSGKSSILKGIERVLDPSMIPSDSIQLSDIRIDPSIVHAAGDSPYLDGNITLEYSLTKKEIEEFTSEFYHWLVEQFQFDESLRLVTGVFGGEDDPSTLRELLKLRISAFAEQIFNQSFSLQIKFGLRGDVFVEGLIVNSDENVSPEFSEYVSRLLPNTTRALYPRESEMIYSKTLSLTRPKGKSLPKQVLTENPMKFVGFNELSRGDITSENARDFLHYLERRHPERFVALGKIIVDTFPDISGFYVGFNEDDNTAEVYVNTTKGMLELGTQGDGIKQIVMFLTSLSVSQVDVLLIDEPENHLHSTLQSIFLEFFLKRGSGQLIIATHAPIIINSISPELLETSEIVVNWVENQDGSTYVYHTTSSDIVMYLLKLGIPPDRYLAHMAAHSRTLIFVEGSSDERYIIKTLKKFGELETLLSVKPHFIQYGGKENISKLKPEWIDAVAKGDSSIESERIPYLIIRDRDEMDTRSLVQSEESPNTFILTVREIENTVLSEKSFNGVLQEFFLGFGIPFDDRIKGQALSEFKTEIECYLPKWILLHLQEQINSIVRPLLKRKSTGEYDKLGTSKASDLADEVQVCARQAHDSLSRFVPADDFSQAMDSVRKECYDEKGNLRFKFIFENIPGKDLMRVIRRTLAKTAETSLDSTHIGKTNLDSLSGQLCTFDSFLKFTEEIHPDMKRLLERLQSIQTLYSDHLET